MASDTDILSRVIGSSGRDGILIAGRTPTCGGLLSLNRKWYFNHECCTFDTLIHRHTLTVASLGHGRYLHTCTTDLHARQTLSKGKVKEVIRVVGDVEVDWVELSRWCLWYSVKVWGPFTPHPAWSWQFLGRVGILFCYWRMGSSSNISSASLDKHTPCKHMHTHIH